MGGEEAQGLAQLRIVGFHRKLDNVWVGFVLRSDVTTDVDFVLNDNISTHSLFWVALVL